MVKITGSNQPTGIHKSVGKPKKSRAKGSKSDSVKVSDAAGLRARAKVMLAEMPDVRLDQIESIRNALENGTYTMNNKAIASHIVRNALSEHAWG
jgi:flagellar biosynthesis anti-sigma factor FlgM